MENKLSKKNIREAQRAKRRKKKLVTSVIWGVVGIGVLFVIVYFVWNVIRPAAGESVPVMANAGSHVPPGTDPGPFNSDPPTSGRHFGQEFNAGFYEESSAQAQEDYPEGYLLHNLEHGYVIFWYNCDLLDETNCSTLKSQIKDVMDDFNNFKLVAFPRTSTDVPLVMTSWGRIQRFDTFDKDDARRFIRSNRNRAPEPNAP
jgi:hypothetical protein